MTGASQKEELRKSLDNLDKSDFTRFKHYLKDAGKIAWRKLERTDINKTLDLMVQVYAQNAGKQMVNILRKMNQNQSASELETNLQIISKCVYYNALWKYVSVSHLSFSVYPFHFLKSFFPIFFSHFSIFQYIPLPLSERPAVFSRKR